MGFFDYKKPYRPISEPAEPRKQNESTESFYRQKVASGYGIQPSAQFWTGTIVSPISYMWSTIAMQRHIDLELMRQMAEKDL